MNRVVVSMVIGIGLALGVSAEPVFAQGNDDDFTPLNSRIRRDRQFPTEPRTYVDPRTISEAGRQRSRNMVDQFARCLWDRSNEDGLSLLSRTDFGFVTFTQIGVDGNRFMELYPVQTCLSRVSSTQNSGVRLSFNAPSMRRWYLQAAYLDTYRDGPSWIVPGLVAAPRVYPLSANNPAVHTALDFADCVVGHDPHAADYLFRTSAESAEESAAIQQIMPSLGPCLPAGQQIELEPASLRVWIGEALWHAANNSVVPPAETSQEAQ